MNPTAAQTPVFLDQHCVAFGTNGSGKTERLVRKMVPARAREIDATGRIPRSIYKVIVCDTKPVGYGGDDELGHFADLGGTIIHDWRDFDPGKIESRIVIFRPNQADISPFLFNEFFDFLRNLRYRNPQGKMAQYPFVIVLDELSDIITADGKQVVYLQSMDKILRQGRQSLQTMWILTQYPVFVGSTIKRLATVRFLFRLPDEKDRKLMKGYFGTDLVTNKIVDPYGFWYQNDMIPRTVAEPYYFTGRP